MATRLLNNSIKAIRKQSCMVFPRVMFSTNTTVDPCSTKAFILNKHNTEYITAGFKPGDGIVCIRRQTRTDEYNRATYSVDHPAFNMGHLVRESYFLDIEPDIIYKAYCDLITNNSEHNDQNNKLKLECKYEKQTKVTLESDINLIDFPEVNNKIWIGDVSYYPSTGCVASVSIHTNWRGFGFGTYMMNRVCNDMKEHGISEMWGSTMPYTCFHNFKGSRWYNGPKWFAKHSHCPIDACVLGGSLSNELADKIKANMVQESVNPYDSNCVSYGYRIPLW